MKFLFISSCFGPSIGGLETLTARMSNWLLRKDHKITLLVNSVTDDFREIFHDGVRVIELGKKFSRLGFYQIANRVWADYQIDRPDVIKAFDLPSSWIASILSSKINPAPKVIFGNYFPHVIPQSRNPLRNLSYRLFLLNLSRNYAGNSILCMSEEEVSQFSEYFGHQTNPVFWPLPVEAPCKDAPARTPKWGHIVSVGRLEPMKEYNLYMIDVVDRLRRRGYPVTWAVYGLGRFAEDMRARIDALGLGDVIQMKGALAYHQFAAAMQDACIFVGMGTSIIEAALCGVPGVVALAYETKGLTYGPLYRFRFGNCGGLMEKPPGTNMEAEIERILTLGGDEYDQEVQRTQEYAGRYAIDDSMNNFLEIVANSSRCSPSPVLFYLYYIHSLVRWPWKIAKKELY
ncbi:MAG: glycosyltransferase family 4 protein [Syntrophobacteraceae bacterium]